MSEKIQVWARGPYELIRHAEGHFNGRSDTDRRIALIGFDNAIEVAITTYLQLNPKLRGGKTFPRENVQKWLTSYHSKIQFLEEFVNEQKSFPQSSMTEILWYHSLRNELYHSGNGMVPEKHCLEGVRFASLEVFKILYGVDVESLLKEQKEFKVSSEKQQDSHLNKQTLFLQAYIHFEQTLKSRALGLGLEVDSRHETLQTLWSMFKSQYEGDFKELDETLRKARFVRNNLVHGGTASLKEKELGELEKELNLLTRFVQNYGFSFNILSVLKDRYGDWVKPDITNVSIIHKNRAAWLEVTSSSNALFDEKSERVKLDFIADVNEEEDDYEVLFSPETSAQESANRFFDDLDLSSILMVGIGDLIFTEKGEEEASQLCIADDGKPLGNITRRPEREKGRF